MIQFISNLNDSEFDKFQISNIFSIKIQIISKFSKLQKLFENQSAWKSIQFKICMILKFSRHEHSQKLATKIKKDHKRRSQKDHKRQPNFRSVYALKILNFQKALKI